MLLGRPVRIMQMQKKREKVASILESQIHVAKRLTKNLNEYSFESRIAWEIVEELSQKLEKIDEDIATAESDYHTYFEKMHRDELLSTREYDI
jgi:D-hexose-6-phosphate mutarotase